MLHRLQKFIPVEDIHVKRSRYGWKEIVLVEKNQQGNLQIHSGQISDGTLRLIAMACLRYGIQRHAVISFEEPENGIHPPILRAAVEMVKEMTQLKPHLRSQVFMTTHSPYVLDMFRDSPDSIFIMEKGTGHGTKVSNVTADQIDLAKVLFGRLFLP